MKQELQTQLKLTEEKKRREMKEKAETVKRMSDELDQWRIKTQQEKQMVSVCKLAQRPTQEHRGQELVGQSSDVPVVLAAVPAFAWVKERSFQYTQL